MRISERDTATAHAIAKLLGVELEPWQDFMLKHMLAGHRQADSPPEVERCGRLYAGAEKAPCHLQVSHAGAHVTADGRFVWPDQPRTSEPEVAQVCGAECPDSFYAAVTCELALGHAGGHQAAPHPGLQPIYWTKSSDD